MRIYRGNRGTSLLDVIFGTSLLLIVFLGVFGALQLSLALVENTRLRTGALAVATERIESIRGMYYEDVGTENGIPSGALEEEDSVILNGVTYTRRTFVQYVDSPEDGLGGADQNGLITDYKTVKVTVSWPFRDSTRTFSLVTNIVPSGIEAIGSGGVLRITVLNASGTPVPSARISVQNSNTSPSVSLTTFTNTAGQVTFPGSPVASGYEISVSKAGYSSAYTYSATGGNPNPNPGHLTVGEGQTTSGTFSIDVLGSLIVKSFLVGTTTPLENIAFSARGGKLIGGSADEDPVYKYSETFSTGPLGSVTLGSLEWDTYTMDINDTAIGYDLAESCAPSPVSLSPGESETVRLSFAPDVAHSLLVDVRDSSGSLLTGASVRLYRSGYDAAEETGACGQTFFNDALSSGTILGGNPYAIDISLAGYQSATVATVEINGDARASVVLSQP